MKTLRPYGAPSSLAPVPRLAPWATFLRPSGASFSHAPFPRLAPWATCLRPSGANGLQEVAQ